MTKNLWNRRDVMAAGGALCVASVAAAEECRMMTRPIPASGEALPVIGLGTYSVFDLASTPDNVARSRRIVELLVDGGGTVIDTSPMYQRSETMIGDVIEAGSPRENLFIATKVWTHGRKSGIEQMRRSAELMNTGRIDLMQVHNLRDTAVHLPVIREWQQDGFIRYNGLTHYHAGAHDELEAEIKRHRPQFVQINYSLGEREAERRILPLAADLGIAVLINRPFQAGALFRAVGDSPLPDWAREFADSWGQFFLKFIVSHPAVTAAIPATSKPRHMQDNLGAGFGALPDAATRKRMIDFVTA